MPTGATVCPSAGWCSQVASQAFKAMLLVWSEDISVVFGSALLRIFFLGIALVNEYCLAFSFLLGSMFSYFFFLPKFGFPIRLPYTSHTPPARSKKMFFSTFLPILEPRKPKILGFSWFAQTSYFVAENLPPNHGGGIFFEVDDPP